MSFGEPAGVGPVVSFLYPGVAPSTFLLGEAFAVDTASLKLETALFMARILAVAPFISLPFLIGLLSL